MKLDTLLIDFMEIFSALLILTRRATLITPSQTFILRKRFGHTFFVTLFLIFWAPLARHQIIRSIGKSKYINDHIRLLKPEIIWAIGNCGVMCLYCFFGFGNQLITFHVCILIYTFIGTYLLRQLKLISKASIINDLDMVKPIFRAKAT